MKIIELGNKALKPIRKTCHSCGTIFEYDKTDIRHDQRENDSYVFCPNNKCNTYISVRINF